MRSMNSFGGSGAEERVVDVQRSVSLTSSSSFALLFFKASESSVSASSHTFALHLYSMVPSFSTASFVLSSSPHQQRRREKHKAAKREA
jgi:hypothetical protein